MQNAINALRAHRDDLVERVKGHDSEAESLSSRINQIRRHAEFAVEAAADISSALRCISEPSVKSVESPVLAASAGGMPPELGLNDPVKLRLSSEAGFVIAVAQYARRPPSYLVEYLAGDGRQTECWFDREAIVAT